MNTSDTHKPHILIQTTVVQTTVIHRQQTIQQPTPVQLKEAHWRTAANQTPFAQEQVAPPLFLHNSHLQHLVQTLRQEPLVQKQLALQLQSAPTPITLGQRLGPCVAAVLNSAPPMVNNYAREILMVGAWLAALRETWEAVWPRQGHDLVQSLARGPLMSLEDERPELAQALRNLLGWGNEDEQSQDQIDWLRHQVRQNLSSTLGQLQRSMRLSEQKTLTGMPLSLF